MTLYCLGRRSVSRERRYFLSIAENCVAGNFHCTIKWDSVETAKSAVKVTDLSSNGTFVSHDSLPLRYHLLFSRSTA